MLTELFLFRDVVSLAEHLSKATICLSVVLLCATVVSHLI